MVTALSAAITAALLLSMLTKAVIALCFGYGRKDTALTNVSGECSKNIVGFSGKGNESNLIMLFHLIFLLQKFIYIGWTL